MHVRGASLPGGGIYSRELTAKDHLLLQQRYPNIEDDRLHLANYGKLMTAERLYLPVMDS